MVNPPHSDAGTDTPRRRSPSRHGGGGPHVTSRQFAVAIACVLAVGLHVFMLGRSTVDADEAVVGLMAQAILHGHFSAFFWGQDFGGSEAYVTAVLFFLFGTSAFTLKLTATLLALTCAILTWRLGRRVVSPEVGVLAGLIFFVWPEANDYAAVREYGFRWAGLTCALVALLLTARVADGDRRKLTAIGLGVALGLGWWSTPEILYAAVPIVAFIAFCVVAQRVRLSWGWGVLAGIGAALGALPWLWANVSNGFDSLTAHGGQRAGYGSLLLSFFKAAFPLALGLRVRLSGAWIGPRDLAVAIYAVLIGVLVLAAVQLARERKGLLIVFCLLCFPFLYAAFPVRDWLEGRFTLALGPTVAILIAYACTSAFAGLIRRSRLMNARESAPALATGCAAVLLIALLGFTAVAMTKVPPEAPSSLGLVQRGVWTWRSDPNNLAHSAISLLKEHGVHDVFAGYWVAYPVSELSGGAVLATDVPLPVRDTALYDAVATSRDPAWLFVTPTGYPAAATEFRQSILDPGCTKAGFACLSAPAFERHLAAAHIGYRAWGNGAFVAVEPDRFVSPRWVLAG